MGQIETRAHRRGMSVLPPGADIPVTGRFAPEAVIAFSFTVTPATRDSEGQRPFPFEVMGTRGRLTDYHVSAKHSRGGPAETDL